jgi:phosphate transport system protein
VSGQPFGIDLAYLQDEVVSLGGLVESMLLESVELLQHCDLDGLEQLSDDERRVREKRLGIEMTALQFVANMRPKGRDLRAAVAMMEIATELERVGEHAQAVARVNYLTVDHHFRKPLAGIYRLAVGVQAMLNRVLAAFVQCDPLTAQSILGDAQKIEALYAQVYQELLEVMSNHPRVINQAVYLSRAAYNLRRSANRVCGMSEWVAYVAAGGTDCGLLDLAQDASQDAPHSRLLQVDQRQSTA